MSCLNTLLLSAVIGHLPVRQELAGVFVPLDVGYCFQRYDLSFQAVKLVSVIETGTSLSTVSYISSHFGVV